MAGPQVNNENNPPRRSERLWSEEVGLAQAGDPAQLNKDVAYEFSNGRKFYDSKGPYVDPAS